MWQASPDEISAALSRIDPVFLNMPLRRSAALDRRFGAELLFKDETANPIRSFKGRGTSNFVAQRKSQAPLVSASAGNFGQGLAWATRSKGIPLTIYASRNAVPSKIKAMRDLGATVILEGEDFDAAKQAGISYAAARGLEFVEDGASAAIAEGAGTIGLEILDEAPEFHSIILPLGNGALAAGVGSWMKFASASTEVVAVAARGAPAMAQSVKANRFVTTNSIDTIADGIAIRIPIMSAVRAVREVVDDVVLVGDDSIGEAMTLVREELDLVVEPAGASGLAALISEPERWRGKRIAIPLCGGNI